MTDADRGGEGETAERPTSRPAPPERSDLSDAEGVQRQTGSPVGLVAVIGAVAALGILAGWIYVWIVLGILLMIFLHELGHYATAKWSGMKVTEFFIGMGPRIWSFHRGETEYGLKAIPAVAYVRIIGMNNLEDPDPEDEANTYRQKSFPKRLLVVSAGSIMHFAQAWIILVVLLAAIGLPGGSLFASDLDESDWVVGSVTANSAASAAGLEAGDRIVAFDGEPVTTFDGLTRQIQAGEAGEEVSLAFERDGERHETTTELIGRPQEAPGAPAGTPFLGVGQDFPEDRVGPLDAVVQASTDTVQATTEVVGAIGGVFSPDGLSDFAANVSEGGASEEEPSSGSSVEEGEGNRPVSIYGAVQIGRSLSQEGVAPALLFFFQLNLFIGLLNMVPLPPFDGGHAAVAIYERIRSRGGKTYRADAAKLLPLASIVVAGLVTVSVLALYLDIVDPVSL